MAGDEIGIGAREEVRVFVAEGEEAGGLDADDGDAGGGEGTQDLDVSAGPVTCGGEHAFGDGWSTAAGEAVDEANTIAARFEDGDGGVADLGVEVVGEGVVKEDCIAAGGGRGHAACSLAIEGSREGVAGEGGEGPLAVQAGGLFEQ